jgi:quercetin dioxygenase-like cupin family protein
VATAELISVTEGAVIPALGMTVKVRAHHCDGELFIVEGVIPPGVMIFPHTHSREDECGYVLDGELTYLIGDEVRVATAGAYVVRPRGIRHAFWNSADAPARVMEIHTPATFDGFYEQVGEIVADLGLDSPKGRAAFDELNARYGLVQHWDLVPQLVERYRIGRR